MRFHYVPSTYRGRKFGKGFCGGAYRGCARICGGSLDDNVEDTPGPIAVPVNIPVQPAQIQQNLLDFPNITPEMIERARNIIAIAEATGKAQPITKKEAGIWSGIKNIGSKIWSGAKAVASNPLVQTAASMAAPYLIGAVAPTLASYVPKALDNVGRYAYNKLDPIYHQEAIKDNSALGNLKEIGSNAGELLTKGAEQIIAAPAAIANAAISAPAKVLGWQAQLANAGANAVKGFASNVWNRLRGRGYRGGRRARLRKGSPEAKAYMARLRAMRGKKKKSGRGYGGMLPKRIVSLLNRGTLAWGGVPNFRGSGYKGGMFRGVSLEALTVLANNADRNGDNFVNVKWKDAYGNNRTTKVSVKNLDKMIDATDNIMRFYDDKDRNKYIKDHYGEKAWPYKNLSFKRYKKLLSSHKNMGVTWKKINDYWNNRTENGKSDFYKKWMDYNYYLPHDPGNKFSNKRVRGKTNRQKRSNISQTRFIRLNKEGLLMEPFKDLVPTRFADVIPDSLKPPDKYVARWVEETGEIDKKNIIKGKRKHAPTLAGLKRAMKRMRKKHKLAAIQMLKRAKNNKSASDLTPILSPSAAMDAVKDDTTAPPPSKIIPKSLPPPPPLPTPLNKSNAPFFSVVKLDEIRKDLANLLKRAQRIKNVANQTKIINDLNIMRDAIDDIEEAMETGDPWESSLKTANKKINQIKKAISETLKLQ